MNNLAIKPPQTSSRAALLIGVDMASGQDESIVRTLNSAKYFADKAQRILNKGENGSTHAVHSMVNSIMTLSMLNHEVLHINVAYAPHCADLEIKVFDADTDYFSAHKAMFSRCVHLDVANTLEQLKNLEDELIELVGQAKDKAMGAV
ncbi:hypothetical protein [Psychromonas aquimarina]|uniref:hypothetical protein n=1 Tax=Psychromonas aquimarina TaxID=444919 RepID=UPI00040BF5A1|nr:hypothetical protein [Psychromonas aquimarina]